MRFPMRIVIAGAVTLAGMGFAGNPANAETICTPGGGSVTCTVEGVQGQTVASRHVSVKALGQTLTEFDTPAVSTPETADRSVTFSVSQPTGGVLAQDVSSCGVKVSVTGGAATIGVAVDGAPVWSTVVAVPAAGDVVELSAC